MTRYYSQLWSETITGRIFRSSNC